MNNLQDVFNRIKETKTKQKEIRKMYKDSLAQNQAYTQIVEQLEELKRKKKEIENEIQGEMMGDMQKLDAYKMHVKTDNEMLADIAINQLMSGERVELIDNNDQKYEPVFSVRFKKA